MTTFRYYVTDTSSGEVLGTNSDKIAGEYAASEDYYVVDSKTGEWLTSDGERQPVTGVMG